jgi:uncharacterized protein (UPF0333 family)
MIKNKGQVSLEFIIAFIMALLIFLTGMMFYQHGQTLNIISEERWSAQKTADNLSGIINTIYVGDDNLSYTEYLNWTRGTIEIENNVIRVFGNGGVFYDSYIVPKNVDWNVVNQDSFIVCSKSNGKVRCDNA